MDEMLINKLFIDGEYEKVVSRLESDIAGKNEVAEEMLYKFFISASLTGDDDARSEAISLIIDQYGDVNREMFTDIARGHMDERMIEASLTIKE
jgi:hypothetical protein